MCHPRHRHDSWGISVACVGYHLSAVRSNGRPVQGDGRTWRILSHIRCLHLPPLDVTITLVFLTEQSFGLIPCGPHSAIETKVRVSRPPLGFLFDPAHVTSTRLSDDDALIHSFPPFHLLTPRYPRARISDHGFVSTCIPHILFSYPLPTQAPLVGSWQPWPLFDPPPSKYGPLPLRPPKHLFHSHSHSRSYSQHHHPLLSAMCPFPCHHLPPR